MPNLITYKVQRFGTNEWLHYSLPIATDGPSHVFSTYETLSGTISPEIGNRLAEDGKPMLWKWGTWIHVETPDERIWTGIIDDVYAKGAVLNVRAREWQGCLHGLTHAGMLWGVQATPHSLVQALFAHGAGFPTGLRGVEVVVHGTPPRLLGKKWDDEVFAKRAALILAEAALETVAKPRKRKEEQIKEVGWPFDVQVKAYEVKMKPHSRAYRTKSREKRDDATLKTRKATLDAHEKSKKEDAAIVAFKAKSKQKSDDASLKTLYRAYEDVRDLPGSKEQIKVAKAAYDVRRLHWDNQLKPLKRPSEDRTKHWDGLIKTAKASYDARVKFWDDQLKPLKEAVDEWQVLITAQKEDREIAVEPLQDQLEVLKAAEEPKIMARDAAADSLKVADESLKKHGGAYKVLPEDRPDSWRILQDLAIEGGFEFTTETVLTHGAPVLKLHLHYGGVGRGRDDLVFEQGRNIIEVPRVSTPDEHASEVIGVGAGQGQTPVEGWELALTRTVTVSDPRMRRNEVYARPEITKPAVLDAEVRAELRRLRAEVVVEEFMVKDDPNCPIGAWRAGDIITPKITVPHYGRIEKKHRIRSWQRVGTHKARIRTEVLGE